LQFKLEERGGGKEAFGKKKGGKGRYLCPQKYIVEDKESYLEKERCWRS